MGDVTVPFDRSNTTDQAVLLLAAAESHGFEASVVRTTQDGYIVPEEVAQTASGVETTQQEKQPQKTEEKPPPAKKAAKKSTSRKGQ